MPQNGVIYESTKAIRCRIVELALLMKNERIFYYHLVQDVEDRFVKVFTCRVSFGGGGGGGGGVSPPLGS